MGTYTGINLFSRNVYIRTILLQFNLLPPGIRLYWPQEHSPLYRVSSPYNISMFPFNRYLSTSFSKFTTTVFGFLLTSIRFDLHRSSLGGDFRTIPRTWKITELQSEDQRFWYPIIERQRNSGDQTPWNNTVGILHYGARNEEGRRTEGYNSVSWQGAPKTRDCRYGPGPGRSTRGGTEWCWCV